MVKFCVLRVRIVIEHWLQSAIGEGRQGGGGGPDDDDFVPLDEVEKIQSEAMEGLRESFTKQITDIENEISELKTDIKQQGDVSNKKDKDLEQPTPTYVFTSSGDRSKTEKSPEGWRGCQQHSRRQAASEDGFNRVHTREDQETD